MLAGELYLASDPELLAARTRARAILREYNATGPEAAERRAALLRGLFARLGPRVEIEPPFHCDYGWNIAAGDNLYMNVGCVILDCAAVTIGDNVLFGPYVQVLAATHPLAPEVRRTGRELAAPVAIGSDVWIGGGAILCPGVRIGDGAVIGAGSIVTRDIPARVLAAGTRAGRSARLGEPGYSGSSGQWHTEILADLSDELLADLAMAGGPGLAIRLSPERMPSAFPFLFAAVTAKVPQQGGTLHAFTPSLMDTECSPSIPLWRNLMWG